MGEGKIATEQQGEPSFLEDALEQAGRENKRLRELLEEKGRELEYAWKVEREAADRIRTAQLQVQDLHAQHYIETQELRGEIRTLREAYFKAQQYIKDSQNIAKLVKLERDGEQARRDLQECEDRLAAIRRAAKRMLS